jgi:hypothetical protein
MHFPRIRSIFGHGITAYSESDIRNFGHDFLASTGMSSSLTHFELKDSLVDQRSLVAMLKIPKALSTLIYEISMTSDSDRDSGVNPVDVLVALAPQCDSLENLWLDCLQSEAVASYFYLCSR